MTDKPPILFINSTYPPVLDDLIEHFTVYNYRDATDKKALVAAAAPHARAVFTNGSAWIPAMLDALPKLAMIACTSTGYDEFDIAAIKRRGIRMSHSTGLTSTDVSDLGMALMLGAARRIPWADRYVRSGDWLAKGRAPMTRRVTGKKLGIVGLGAIGRKVAKKASGFDMDISYTGPRRKDDVDFKYYADLEAMARDADCLVVTCALTETTRNLVDARILAALGKEGFLVNVARGPIVDEDALIAALGDGGIAGAALDVFRDEPQVPAALRAMENVVLAAHIGTSTKEVREGRHRMLLSDMRAYLEGRPLRYPVPL